MRVSGRISRIILTQVRVSCQASALEAKQQCGILRWSPIRKRFGGMRMFIGVGPGECAIVAALLLIIILLLVLNLRTRR